MTVRPLAYLLMTTIAPLSAASNEERIEVLERDVAELQTLIRELGVRASRQEAVTDTEKQTPQKSSGYLVRPGDSYWSIARRFGISVSSLERANPNLNPKRLRIGSHLHIPGQTAAKTGPSSNRSRSSKGTYTIRSGDILGRISEAHGIRLHELLSANPGLDPRRLKIGKVLVIPGQEMAGTPKPAPTPEPHEPAKKREIEKETTSSRIAKVSQSEPSIEQAEVSEASAPRPDIPSPFDLPKATLVSVDENTRLGEIAKKHQTSVAVLNRLNDVDLSPEQMIKTGSQLYVPSR